MGLALEGIVVPKEVCGGLRLDVGRQGAHRRQGQQEERNREHQLPFLSLLRCLPAGVCRTNASKKRILMVPCNRTQHDIENRHRLHTAHNL